MQQLRPPVQALPAPHLQARPLQASDVAGLQVMPQPPQLWKSFWVSTQVVPQHVAVVAQVLPPQTHVPALHVSLNWQAWPHCPQLSVSV